jgi:N-methylhydantoinase B
MNTSAPQAVDPITTEILRNGFNAVAEEMNATLIRSAYTPIIYELKDCAVALLDDRHQTLGQSSGLPIFLGNLETCTLYTERAHGRDVWAPGDVWILNDSYIAGTHLNDMTVFGPIFFEGLLVGFAASRAHWLDVGAKDPGGPMDSTEIFQEGLRIPPIRVVNGGTTDDDLVELICLNGRFPASARGDLGAQIATVRTGERRLEALLRRHGLETMRAARDQIFAQSERLDRDAVASIPDGVYQAKGTIDSDGISDESRQVSVRIVVDGDQMTMDLSGTAAIGAGPVNCGEAQAIAACRVAFKALVNPDRAVTGGTFAPLRVEVRQGSMFAAQAPAPCQWYFSPLGLLIDLAIKALAEALPERVAAASYGDSMIYSVFGVDPRSGSPFLDLEATVGGWGAWEGGDGESALINNVNGSVKDLPIEVAETKYPYRVERYQLRTDSGGAGQWRGGNGVVRHLRILADDAFLSLWFERSRTPAWGLQEGGGAAGPAVTIESVGGERSLLKGNRLPLRKGDLVRLETGGGGGFGPPAARPAKQLENDLHEGFVSADAAREIWGQPAAGGLDGA